MLATLDRTGHSRDVQQKIERPILFTGPMVRAILDGHKTQTRRVIKFQEHACFTGDCGHQKQSECDAELEAESPYRVGYHLGVREAYLNNALLGYPPVYFYRADDPIKPGDRRWISGRFMPRGAVRLFLEVVSVRVQRLQDISRDDALAEGMPFRNHCWKDEWRDLWDSINTKRGYGWDKNPWVWVITFKRL